MTERSASATAAKAVLCVECEEFLRSNHDAKWGRFIDSPVNQRGAAEVVGAAEAGCCLCEAVVRKFNSLASDSSSLVQKTAQPVTFRLLIRPHWNTNLQWEEDIDRPFLQVSILQSQIEFRLWRVIDIPTADGATSDDHATGSESSFARAEYWLRECMLKHESCNGFNTPRNWAPSRLIDVRSSSQFPDTIKLRRTKDWQTPIRYAALSHCWGSVRPLRLLKSNLDALMNGISTFDLPKTFQDAVHATRKLGIQYLWIDSLCIIQDSPDDWDLESSLMTYVYGGCLLNLAAASSSDCTGGLFQNRPSSYLGPCFITVENQHVASVSHYQLWDQDLWPTSLEFAKLNRRAWVMQERMLSPRTLAFAESQLFWECRCKRASEEFPSEFPIELFEKRQRDFDQPEFHDKLKTHTLNQHVDSRFGDKRIARLSLTWHNLVMLYSTKEMTFERDKLVAVAGLAGLFAKQMGTNYIAGLWEITLLSDLLWKVNADKCVRGRRPLIYRAPSWSWASVGCPVKYRPGWITSNKVTVINVKIDNVPITSQFGKVSGGCLQLQGKLFSDLHLIIDAGSRYSLKKRDSEDSVLVANCTPDEQATFTDIQAELFCLPIGSYFDSTRAMGGEEFDSVALVLLPQSNQPNGYYTRWGIFEATQSEFFKDPQNEAPIERFTDGGENMIIIS